ncbi:FecR domain-containing protein [Bradyrhizobium sp.]|uniref:FecR domain-containing protein n=1 Tax=Bradyrhizobium sp. TaxID=376 RepID=UPI0039C89642
MTSNRLSHAIWLLGFLVVGAVAPARAMPAPADAARMLTVDEASPGVELAQAQPTPSPSPSPQPGDASAPADPQAASNEPIGNVASLTGVATVIRNRDSIALKLKDDIYLNDTVATAASSSLGITFNDATTFHLSADAKITIDTYVYEENGGSNAGVFDIAKGTVAFVAAQVAKTGNMQIATPTATLGIRGTTGLVEVPEGATAPGATNNVNIKLYPDADGHVGRIVVNDRQGARLGALTQGASGFAIRPGATAGARFAAVPLTISPQQRARDQGFVQQVHATQTVGRQIVTEQRAFRRANPGLNNRNAPQRPGQPQQPGRNRPAQPNQPQRPGTPNNKQGQPQPGQSPRPGQNTQPGTPSRPGQNNTRPTTPAKPGTPPRRGRNNALPTNPEQPGAPRRPGLNNTQPVTPAQPGTPPRPNGGPREPSPPPLPHGQPLLRQPPARPQVVPGAPRTGFQNRPVPPRPGRPPPKEKKEKR